MSARFFDPEGLSRIGHLELIARQAVEGFLAGRHRSPYQGYSVEYLDHRPYTPGDEIRALDWKVLARSDKYYVKLFEDETNLRAYILLDCSRSMTFRSNGVDKLTWGSHLAAALAHLMLRQNDAVGLLLFDSEIRAYLPPRAHPSQFRRALEVLEQAAPGGETDVGRILHETAQRIKRRGLVVLISDLIDDEQQIAGGLQHFRHDQHEVIVFHTLDDAELTFPFDHITRFKDIEGAGRVVVNPANLRKRYVARMQAFVDRVQHDCFARRISYQRANTNQPYAECLAAFLDKRKRIG
jgi:uncharacterized protein (DUF58 family)